MGSKVYVHMPVHQRHGKFDSTAVTNTLVGCFRGNAFRVLPGEDDKNIELRDTKIQGNKASMIDGASSEDMIEYDL